MELRQATRIQCLQYLTYLKKYTKLIQLTDGLAKLTVFENSLFYGCLRVNAKVNFDPTETARLV